MNAEVHLVPPEANPLPDGYVVHLPPIVQPRIPHAFGDPITIAAEISCSGHEQHERTCKACGAVKVTVIGEGDNHHRAWRKSACADQIDTYVALPCEPKP